MKGDIMVGGQAYQRQTSKGESVATSASDNSGGARRARAWWQRRQYQAMAAGGASDRRNRICFARGAASKWQNNIEWTCDISERR